MKIIGIELKKITVGRFFPKEDKVELEISFNDGSDKEIFKVVDTSDSEGAAEEILNDLRKMERNIHKSNDNAEAVVGDTLNIVVKNEEKLVEEISKFIQQIKVKMDEIKNKKVAEGYLNMIRKLKGLKLDFTEVS